MWSRLLVSKSTGWSCDWDTAWRTVFIGHSQFFVKFWLICNARFLLQIVLITKLFKSRWLGLLLVLVPLRIELNLRSNASMNKGSCFTVRRIILHKYARWIQLSPALKLNLLKIQITILLTILHTTWWFWIKQLVWNLIYPAMRGVHHFFSRSYLLTHFCVVVDQRSFLDVRRF